MSDLQSRFWEKVRKGEGCWEWTGNRHETGYGLVKENGRQVRAHRRSYELVHGAIPAGLCVLHRCDNPPCVRPDHLFLGTRADNSRDMVEKRRQARGSRSGLAKIDETQAWHILADDRPYPEIAKAYKLSVSAVKKIKVRQSWRHTLVHKEVFPEVRR